jgi:hypothetical protein
MEKHLANFHAKAIEEMTELVLVWMRKYLANFHAKASDEMKELVWFG